MGIFSSQQSLTLQVLDQKSWAEDREAGRGNSEKGLESSVAPVSGGHLESRGGENAMCLRLSQGSLLFILQEEMRTDVSLGARKRARMS